MGTARQAPTRGDRLRRYLVGSIADGGVPAEQAARGVDVLLLHATALAVEHGERSQAANAAEMRHN